MANSTNHFSRKRLKIIQMNEVMARDKDIEFFKIFLSVDNEVLKVTSLVFYIQKPTLHFNFIDEKEGFCQP